MAYIIFVYYVYSIKMNEAEAIKLPNIAEDALLTVLSYHLK